MQFMPNAANAPVRGGTAAQKSIRRAYKPAPTFRYMVAGMTAILLSMALISGAMSTTMHFDERPWDSSQEPRWDPFEHQMILDVGSLSESGMRQKDNVLKKQESGSGVATTEGSAAEPPVEGGTADTDPKD